MTRRTATRSRAAQSRRRRDKERRRRRRGGLAVVLSLLVVLGIGGALAFGGLSLISDYLGPAPDYPGPGRDEVVVQVAEGDSVTAIGRTLEQAGVVKSTDAFVDAAGDDPASTGLQPGHYRLKLEMRAADALTLMLDPASRILGRVTIPEGTRLSKSLELFAEGTDIPLEDFQAAAEQPEEIGLPSYAEHSAEGFVFPATYDVEPDATAVDVLRQAVDRYTQAAEELDLEAGAKQQGMSTYELLTVASLVQAEAKHAEDYPKVARVIYNRLEEGMPLQFDSTVNYALDATKTDVTYDDLEVDSPYNTYENKGLPPGPINSPGEQALRAALEPAEGDWLYFVTVDDAGTTKFTGSYDEFLRFKQEMKDNKK